MNKNTKIILIVVAIIAIVGIIALIAKPSNTEENGKLEVKTAEDLKNLAEKVYEGVSQDLLLMLDTSAVDVSISEMVKTYTGLENGNDLQYLVVSQPMMSSQAYQFVLAKVKSGVDANAVAKKMLDQVDTRRWICVETELNYATNSGDIVCLVMGDSEREDLTKAVYAEFKKLAGKVGQEHTREVEPMDFDFPADMDVF